MKMQNFVKETLEKRNYALGAFVASGSAMNCECLALNGLDFIIIDAEHAQTSTETMVEMARASELYGMAAFARVYDPYDEPFTRWGHSRHHGPPGRNPGTGRYGHPVYEIPPAGKAGGQRRPGPALGHL